MEMIDRDARTKAAGILREFVGGSITNEEYEQMYPESEIDPSLHEIYFQIWFLYSDIREHRLTGKHSLNVEQSAIVERCILFLITDSEYDWPSQRIQPRQAFLRLLGLRKKIEKTDYGDESVWPFFDTTQYERALKEVAD